MIYSNNTYDITNDISTYLRRDFNSVFDTSRNKWYMLNNLNQYEEYGIYGDSLYGTYYTGKLVIVNDHEYEWNGTEWDDLGTPTMIPYIQFPNSTSTSNSPYFNTGLYLKNTHSLEIKIKTPASIGTTRLMLGATERFPQSGNEYMWWISDARVLSIGQWNYGRALAQQDLTLGLNTEYIFEIEVGTGITKINGVTQSFTVYGNNVTGTLNVEFLLGTWLGFSAPGWNGRIYYMKVKEGDNLIAYYEATNTDNTPGYIEKVSETKILQSGGGTVTYGEESGAFPKDYPEKTTPTISTLWPSTIYRNSAHLTTLMRNDAEIAKIDYMSDDIFRKGSVH